MGRANREACAQIAFDTKAKTWEVIVPKQVVTSVSVDYDPNEAISFTAYRESLVLVADIHSHHKMLPFYSCTDDADEVGVRLYGVLGNLRGTSYDIIFRAGAGGHFVRIPAEDILEGYAERNSSSDRLFSGQNVPSGWFKKITLLDNAAYK